MKTQRSLKQTLLATLMIYSIILPLLFVPLAPAQDRLGRGSIRSFDEMEKAVPEASTPEFSETVCGWVPSAAYPETIDYRASAVQGNVLYSFGGLSAGQATELAFRFDGADWTAIAPLPEPIVSAAAVSDGTYIYVIGGYNDGNDPGVAVYRYDPVQNSYTAFDPLPEGRASHSAAFLNNKIYVWGGDTDAPGNFAADSMVISDLSDWTAGPSIPEGSAYSSVFVHGGYIYSLGGLLDFEPFDLNSASNRTFRYDPVTNGWDDEAIADLPPTTSTGSPVFGRLGAASSTTAVSSQLILAGGSFVMASGIPTYTYDVLYWNPVTNAWAFLPSLFAVSPIGFGNGAVLSGDFYVTFRRTGSKLACGLNRFLRVEGRTVRPGDPVTIPISFTRVGDENAVGFTLAYDETLLSNPIVTIQDTFPDTTLEVNSTTAGRVAVLAARPAGQIWNPGASDLITVQFDTVETATPETRISFADSPTILQVSDVNAQVLPSGFIDGTVTLSQGYESDVAPRPSGNNDGTVSVADLTQMGRFVVGLDPIDPGFSEFQRADTAPIQTLGDGMISVIDYTQAGRDAAGLDAVRAKGGPTSVLSLFEYLKCEPILTKDPYAGAAGTEVSIGNAVVSRGQPVVIPVTADAQGSENGFGFTLDYDPLVLGSPVVQKGAGLQDATLFVNTLTSGKVGVVLAMPSGTTISAGQKAIANIGFTVRSDAPIGESNLTLNDAPVLRQISDVNANVVKSQWQSGTVTILAPTAAGVTVSGRAVDNRGRGVANTLIALSDSFGNTIKTATNSFGYYRINDVRAGETYIISAWARRHTFAESTRVISVSDDVTDMDFIASGP